MSSMKDAYLNTLRPMDGQQADPPEPKVETAPAHPNQQPLFVTGTFSDEFLAEFDEWMSGE